MSDVVMFIFAGRKANMELQLPYLLEILLEHPEVVIDVWDLARTVDDRAYIATWSTVHPRLRVRTDFAGGKTPWDHFNDVYRFYTQDVYKGTLFVKLDDDVVFIETARFRGFLTEVHENPDAVVSAKVVNNGACGVHFPSIDAGFKKLRFPLLDVHLHPSYLKMCHYEFLTHPNAFIEEKWDLIPTTDWLSINFIGYNWEMACRIASLLNTPSPRHIAGRHFFKPHAKLGDEGLVNTLPRIIVQGFTVSHLTFGPQEKQISRRELDDIRAQYTLIGEDYLK